MDFLTKLSDLAAAIRAKMSAGVADVQAELDEALDNLAQVTNERDAALGLLEELAAPDPEPVVEPDPPAPPPPLEEPEV